MKFRRKIVLAPNHEPMALEHLPVFKLYSCPDSFPRPPHLIGHHPCFLEYSFEERAGVEALADFGYDLKEKPRFEDHKTFPVSDGIVENSDAAARQDEIEILINALSPYKIFSYGGYKAWFISFGENKVPQSQYGQEGYWYTFDTDITEIEPTGSYHYLDPVAFRIRLDGASTAQPVHASQLFSLYFDREADDLKRGYLNACKIFSKSQRLEAIPKPV